MTPPGAILIPETALKFCLKIEKYDLDGLTRLKIDNWGGLLAGYSWWKILTAPVPV